LVFEAGGPYEAVIVAGGRSVAVATHVKGACAHASDPRVCWIGAAGHWRERVAEGDRDVLAGEGLNRGRRQCKPQVGAEVGDKVVRAAGRGRQGGSRGRHSSVRAIDACLKPPR